MRVECRSVTGHKHHFFSRQNIEAMCQFGKLDSRVRFLCGGSISVQISPSLAWMLVSGLFQCKTNPTHARGQVRDSAAGDRRARKLERAPTGPSSFVINGKLGAIQTDQRLVLIVDGRVGAAGRKVSPLAYQTSELNDGRQGL